MAYPYGWRPLHIIGSLLNTVEHALNDIWRPLGTAWYMIWFMSPIAELYVFYGSPECYLCPAHRIPLTQHQPTS